MRKVITVAVREYEAAVRTKTFLISIVMMPVLMSGGIIAQEFTERHADVSDKRFAVIDHTGRLYQAIASAAEQRNADDIFEIDEDDQTRRQVASRFLLEQADLTDRDPGQLLVELSDRVRNKEIVGFVEIRQGIFEADLFASDSALVAYHSSNPVYHRFRDWVARPINDAVQKWRFEQRGLTEEDVGWAVQQVFIRKDLGLVSMVDGKIQEAGAEAAQARIGVGVILTVLLFMVIALGAAPLINVVIEEKTQGIVEVLIGSVRPFELMLGKLLGSVAVSLTVVGVYLAGGYAVAIKLGYGDFLPPASLLAWFLVFQATAILLFGSMFLAIGAACSDLKEAQSALLPVWLLVCIPLFALGPVIEQPSGSLATGLSLFPLATPMLMPLRISIDPTLPLWQPAAGMMLVVLSTVLCVFAAGRIFRIGILAQGKGFKVGQLIRWVVRG